MSDLYAVLGLGIALGLIFGYGIARLAMEYNLERKKSEQARHTEVVYDFDIWQGGRK